MPMKIQYAGFQVQRHGRDYSYDVLAPPSASRHFTFTISHQAFAEKQILYQDAADLCYQKLQRELLREAEEPLPPSPCLVSEQELDLYRETHRPAKQHVWPRGIGHGAGPTPLP